MENAIEQSCFDCSLRPDRLFCDLPAEALESFDSIKSVVLHPRNATLYGEGSAPKAIFLLCEGRARLSVCGEKGRRLTLRIAGPGEILGLSSCLSGSPCELTAETVDEAKVAVVGQKELLKFLRNHREACLHVVHLLSQDLHHAYDRVRSVGLARTRRARGTRVRLH